ncbi:MAG: amidohydrolase family protein [Candidatus Binataceae bacterium]
MERPREDIPHESFHRLKYAGAVDADGHVLEAPDLWERYLEPRYKRNALRIRRDNRGVDYLEIAGRPSKITRGPIFAQMSAMGTRRDRAEERRQLTYGVGAPLGAMDPDERLDRLDREGLRAAFLYPTLGFCWETECLDSELAQAYTRAYNRWIVDFCADSHGRLIPVAHLSLGDPEAAARELERAVKDGCKGGWVAQFTLTHKPHGHPDHDVLFAKAQELDVPLGIHPSLEPVWALPGRFDYQYVRDYPFFLNVTAGDAVRHGFTSFFHYGVFDKFPRLKLVVLEVGGGWIGYWLDRLDAVYDSMIGRGVPLREQPSFYFQRNCWISADPDERSLPAMVELCGADKFFWASDFPHPDHAGNYIEDLEKMAARLDERARPKVLGESVMRVYNCAI